MKKCNEIKHAYNMVLKNKRGYLMLSVTILLSFTFFLGYLVYIDSGYMTQYGKDIYSDINIIEAMCPIEDDQIRFNLFKSALEKMDDTYYYVWNDAYVDTSIVEEGMPNCAIILPQSVWGMHDDLYNRIFTGSNKEFRLEKNEAIVSKNVYLKLKKKFKDKTIKITLPIQTKSGNIHYLKLKVKDGCYSSNNTSYIDNNIYISYETMKDIDFISHNSHLFIYSKQPSEVVEIMRNYEVAGDSTYENKKAAYADITQKVKFKYIIAVILFVILGINMYSSFKNALNDRKFEIGVKRAIGASKANIIKQFFYEGCIVVMVNILASSVLVSIGFIIYKMYKIIIEKSIYNIYISKYSIIMYLVLSIAMTIVFSVIFAIQSSRVEIIKHLKSE